MQLNFFRLLIMLFLITNLGACSSTQFISTWKDPEIAIGKLNGEKVAAFLISEDESSRRATETALAAELTARGAQGVAGFTVLSADASKDKEIAKQKLKEAGVDAVITLRVVSEEQRATTIPEVWHTSPNYSRWGDYWFSSWSTIHEPSDVRIDTILKVETLIYTMDSEKLIWSGLSQTTNPSQMDAFIKEFAKAVDEAIAKSQLLR